LQHNKKADILALKSNQHGTTSNRLNFIDNSNNNIRCLPPAPEINFAPQQNFMLQQNHINLY